MTSAHFDKKSNRAAIDFLNNQKIKPSVKHS